MSYSKDLSAVQMDQKITKNVDRKENRLGEILKGCLQKAKDDIYRMARKLYMRKNM